jgi:hypothetical protein
MRPAEYFPPRRYEPEGCQTCPLIIAALACLLAFVGMCIAFTYLPLLGVVINAEDLASRS